MEGVDEDDWDFARRQVSQLVQQIQDDNIARNQGTRECWPLKALDSIPQRLQRALLQYRDAQCMVSSAKMLILHACLDALKAAC